MAVPSDLYVNNPGGVYRLTGLRWVEGGAFHIWWTVLASGEPVDMSTCTVDLATITAGVAGPELAPVTVDLAATGTVTLTAELPITGTDRRAYPNGSEAILTVRLRDAGGTAFYLVAPSPITIKHGTGATT